MPVPDSLKIINIENRAINKNLFFDEIFLSLNIKTITTHKNIAKLLGTKKVPEGRALKPKKFLP